MTDPSSVIQKEAEDEDGQVEAGTFAASVRSRMCLMDKRTSHLRRTKISLMISLHRDTWLRNTERN